MAMVFLDAENTFANLECVSCEQQIHMCKVQPFLLFSAHYTGISLDWQLSQLLDKAQRHSRQVRPFSLVFM